MKKGYRLLVCVVLIAVLICGCRQKGKLIEEQQTQPKPEQPQSINNTELEGEEISEKIGQNLPISRALAAKMIVLSLHEPTEIDAIDDEAEFSDVSKEDWYYKYINFASVSGYMSGSEEGFRPLEPLSLYEAQVLLDKINSGNKTKIKLTEETKNKPISYSLWCELFQKDIKELSADKTVAEEFGLTEKNYIIFATPANSELAPWQMATDQGIVSFSGFAMDAYVDKKIKLLVKGGEMVMALEVIENEPVLEGAYIKEKTENGLKVYMGGAQRTLNYEKILEEETPFIADIKLSQESITELAQVNELKSGVVKKADAGVIELEELGELKTRQSIKIYEEKNGEIYWRGIRNLICGADIADYYIKNGEVCAAVIRRETLPNNMRVVVSNTGFNGYQHETVSLYFEGDYTLKSGAGQKQIKSGESIELTLENTQKGRSYFVPMDNKNKITIKSISKGGGLAPSYTGSIEAERKDDCFVIVNETDIESYLCGVVPSEMPSSYGIEAAKIQAVTARSYAYNQFYANKYYNYGANVDDSTSCQVYNNTAENETSSEGVKATEGLCLTYESEVLSANFFSTSAGSRANSGEVWADMGSKKFPAYTPPYASAGKEYTKGEYGDLSVEENAAAFFKDWTVEGYDRNSGWFRWKIQLSAEELRAILSSNLKSAYERNPFLVKTLQPNGNYKSRSIEDIGEINDIFVAKRGEGGNVMELVIQGSKAQVLLMTELNIRKTLAPVQKTASGKPITINCINGVVMNDYALMPSAFFAVEKDISPEGKLLSVTFYGGGNGHGVGMSQNGVKGMLDAGFQYDEILKHYYKGAEIVNKFE